MMTAPSSILTLPRLRRPTPRWNIVPIDEAVPPATKEDVPRLRGLKKRDANDLLTELGPDGLMQWLNEQPVRCVHEEPSAVETGLELMEQYPELRPTIISGIARVGEVVNLIAAPKKGKSFLTYNVGMNIIAGGMLFDRFKCERGNVLVVDNELHRETISYRLKVTADAFGIPRDIAGRHMHFVCLRGEGVDLIELQSKLDGIRAGQYRLVVLDAFYKMFPPFVEENSNSDMARMYAMLDKYAESLQSAILVVHHASKGLQADKDVTDVGSGAGSQSRAVDDHLVLRPHEDENLVVFEAAPRTFPPPEPFCVRFNYPKWDVVEGADASQLRGRKLKPAEQQMVKSQAAAEVVQAEVAVYEKFLTTLPAPFSLATAQALGMGVGLPHWTRNKVSSLFTLWANQGKLVKVSDAKGRIAATFRCSEKLIAEQAAKPDVEQQAGEQPQPYEPPPMVAWGEEEKPLTD